MVGHVQLTGCYICTHNDNIFSSILYADIVSFTPLTANLEPQELVHALNQLFGRFDDIAKVIFRSLDNLILNFPRFIVELKPLFSCKIAELT